MATKMVDKKIDINEVINQDMCIFLYVDLPHLIANVIANLVTYNCGHCPLPSWLAMSLINHHCLFPFFGHDIDMVEKLARSYRYEN